MSFPRFFKSPPIQDRPPANPVNSANLPDSGIPKLATLAGLAAPRSQGASVADPPPTDEPSASAVLAEALDRIADAISRSPRSPILNDLALSHAARAIVEAGRVLRSLPDGARAQAARLCERSFAEAASLIERARYADAYEALDGLPTKILRNFQ
jgi:hypothetical protein